MRQSFALVALIALLLLVGLALRSAPIGGLALLPLVWLVVGLVASADSRISAEREVSHTRLAAGELLSVTVRLTNDGPETIHELHIHDPLPWMLHRVDGDTRAIAPLAPGEQIALHYRARGPRGAYQFHPLQLAWCDPSGLFWRRQTLTAGGAYRMVMTERPRPAPPVMLRPPQTRAFAGVIPARVGGPGTDFHAVRSYRMGDSLRHINWRAGARHHEALYTNEFEQERVADVGLIVDARYRAVTCGGSSVMLERMLAAAGAFALSLLGQGHRVSLLVYGKYLDWTLPGVGRVQQQRILHALSVTHVGDSQVFDNLDHLPTRIFPARSQLILFSPLLPDDVRALHRVRARGYALMVISPNRVLVEQAHLPADDITALATRLATLERRQLLRESGRSGVQVIDWRDEPVDQLVRRFLQRPQRGRGRL